MGIYGGPTSVAWGDIEEHYLDYLVKDAGEGAYVTLSHPAGYGDSWSAIVADGRVVEIIYIAEGEKKTRFAPYDPAFESHSASAFPLKDWDSAGDIDVTIGQVDFLSDKGGSLEVSFAAVMQVAESWGDLQQLSGWALTGLSRFATSRAGAIKTQAKVDVAISDVAGTRTVVLSVAGVAVASGSRVGDGLITLTAQNNSQLSGSVTIAYTADVAADCWITGCWCQSYTVTVGSVSTTVYDNGRGDILSATLTGLAPGLNAISIVALSDKGIAGVAYVGSATIPGRPEPPGELSYVSGNWSNTVIQAAASATPGATYGLFDVEVLDGPIKYSEVAAVYPSGSGVISFALPSLPGAAAGKRRLVLSAFNGTVQDGKRRTLTIEYDAAGNVVLPRPNIPAFGYSQPNPVTSGRTISVDWSYDGNGADGVATKIVAFIVAEGGATPADGAVPDAEVAIGAGSNGIYRGSISALAPADGNFRMLIRAQTLAGTQSANSNILSEPVPVSNAVPPAVSDVQTKVVQ